ncbi:MAG TPA: metalloregulator ArsR/SmtB family transcription factor [Clostridia bacterium]|nr:metalloregulator ArsR/SmtB family transcription factor [Clostridia bacterium]
MEIDSMEVNVFKALAHPIRLKIIKKLSEKVYCVCEMNEDVEFSQSNLSQHLRILKEAEIVYSKKEGMRINYYIKNQDTLQLISIVEELVRKNIKEMNEKFDD